MHVKFTAPVSPLLQGRFVLAEEIPNGDTTDVDVVYWDTRRRIKLETSHLEAVPPHVEAAVLYHAFRTSHHDPHYEQLRVALNALRREIIPETHDGRSLLLAPTEWVLEELPNLAALRSTLAAHYGEAAVPAAESFQPWWNRLLKAIASYNRVEGDLFGVIFT